jgi:hypothetical protein
MVTDAVWHDLNDNGDRELIVTCEWAAPKVYRRGGNSFVEAAAEFGLGLPNGLWSSVSVCDPNGDGKQDLLFGNWGQNSILTAERDRPLKLLINDFDGNGVEESLLCIYLSDTLDSFLGRNEICAAMPKFWKKYNTYQRFAVTPLSDKFSSEEAKLSEELTVTSLSSVLLMNKGSGTYGKMELPFASQAAPIKTVVTLKGDSRMCLLGGDDSFHFSEGGSEALGVQLLGLSQSGEFKIYRPEKREIAVLFSNVSDAKTITVKGEEFLLVARPLDELLLIRP